LDMRGMNQAAQLDAHLFSEGHPNGRVIDRHSPCPPTRLP
jgi:hypothetical protein